MPAIVPPGFMRGPILMLGPCGAEQAEAELLQRFWTEAGGYGARILLLSIEADERLTHYQQLFQAWEAAEVAGLVISDRRAAQQRTHLAQIDQATALLLLDADPLRLTMTLGGTPVAQAMRRANAHGKVVAGLGLAATTFCQHMLLFDQAPDSGRIQFAPGFGLINRLALDLPSPTSSPDVGRQARLASAVAYNPFLIGVSLRPESGIAIYADTSLEAFGRHEVLIVDGAAVDAIDAQQLDHRVMPSGDGWRIHTLRAGHTFNFDQRTVHTPLPSDIPNSGIPLQSAG